MEWLPLLSEIPGQALGQATASRLRGTRIRHFIYSNAVLDNASGGVICNDCFMPPARGKRFELTKVAIQSIVASATQTTSNLDITVGYRAGWGNYYHWTTQCLLNIYWLHCQGLLEGSLLAIPNLGPTHQRSLQLLGIPPEKLYRVGKTGALRARTLKMTQLLFSLTASRFPSELQSMAAKLKENSISINTSPHHQSIYISRLGSHRRRMANEEDLVKALEKLGVAHVSMSSKTLDEQIAIMADAKLIVAPHGAALTNILYSQPGAHLYELFPSSYVVRCYEAVAQATQVGYSDSIFKSSAGENHDTVWSADVDEVCRKTEALLTRRNQA